MIQREESVETVLGQERCFQFVNFTHADALFVLNHSIDDAKANFLKPVTVHIERDGLVVARHLMDGRGDSHWVARKIKTVMESQHSSLYVFKKADAVEQYQTWVEDPTYAICGGGFPIIIQGQVRGCIIVSGLEHYKDHRLIINALEDLKQKEEAIL